MVDVGPAGASSSGSSQNNSNSGEEDKKDERMFECNICLDTAKDAVISMCGHLFCWPCLHQWLETRPARQMCPVCKAAISKEKVIPLYGRGSSKQEDPRNKAPPRPAGQRTEPEANATQGDLSWTDGESSEAESLEANDLLNLVASLDFIMNNQMDTSFSTDLDSSFSRYSSCSNFSNEEFMDRDETSMSENTGEDGNIEQSGSDWTDEQAEDSSCSLVSSEEFSDREDTGEDENIADQSASDEQAQDTEIPAKISYSSEDDSVEEAGSKSDQSSEEIAIFSDSSSSSY